jgi:hypothetical protein
MPVEEPINKVGGSTLNEPHNVRQAHEPSFLIPTRREDQMCMSGHHHHRMQIDGHAMLLQATLEDQLPRIGGKLPPFKCPEGHENGTIVFEYVWQRAPVRVFPVKIHLPLNSKVRSPAQ